MVTFQSLLIASQVSEFSQVFYKRITVCEDAYIILFHILHIVKSNNCMSNRE